MCDSETFTENVKPVHYQVCVWKNLLDSDPSDMSPMNFGLLHEETIKTPSPVTVPHGIPSIHQMLVPYRETIWNNVLWV